VNAETAGLLATSALSSAGLLITAFEGRRQRQLLRVQFVEHSVERYMGFQTRFYGLVGSPKDGIQPPEWRVLMVKFFNFYGQLFLAHREGVFPQAQWEDLRVSLAYWARRPQIREAWDVLSQQPDAWPAGFVAFMESELSDVASDAERLWESTPPSPEAWARLREDLGA